MNQSNRASPNTNNQHRIKTLPICMKPMKEKWKPSSGYGIYVDCWSRITMTQHLLIHKFMETRFSMLLYLSNAFDSFVQMSVLMTFHLEIHVFSMIVLLLLQIFSSPLSLTVKKWYILTCTYHWMKPYILQELVLPFTNTIKTRQQSMDCYSEVSTVSNFRTPTPP